jgi:hypothetical protein
MPIPPSGIVHGHLTRTVGYKKELGIKPDYYASQSINNRITVSGILHLEKNRHFFK